MWHLVNNVLRMFLEILFSSASDPKSQTTAELCGSRIWDRKNLRILVKPLKYHAQFCSQNRINIGFRALTESK
jgi:hypothetical protein